MFVPCVCCVLCWRVLCQKLISLSEEPKWVHMSKCVGSRNLKNGAAYTRVRLLSYRNKLLDQPVISQSRNFLHLLALIRCLCYMLPAERFLFLYDNSDFLLSGFSLLSCIPCCKLCFDFITTSFS